MANATALYTVDVLGLATSLAAFPWDDTLPLKGNARSKTCGSTISLALELDSQGRIFRLGLRSQACAIGQAAAAIFAQAAQGRNALEIILSHDAIEAWLAGEGPLPDWPGFVAIATARDFPARHGAIKLAWQAARDVLPTRGMPR